MTPVQEIAWESMLDAQLEALYWEKKTYWIGFRLNCIKFTSGLIGCAAFGSLFLDPGWAPWSKAATLIAAALALYLSVFDPKNAFEQARQAQEEYKEIYDWHGDLWGRVLLGLSEEEINAEIESLRKEARKIKTPHVGFSKRLLDKSFGEILAARGMVNA
jgi:hypothetical protein